MRSWLFVVFPLIGCNGGGGDIGEVTFVPGAIPGTGQITFTTDVEGDARVQMGLAGEALDIASPGAPAAGGVIPLLGLQTGKAYEMKVVVGEDESEVIEVTIAPPSQGVPPLQVVSSDPAKMCNSDGYILFSYIGGSKSGVAIIDREANFVWTVAEEDTSLQVGRARPGRDGKSILWNDADAAKCDDTATITRQPMDGSAKTVTRTLNGHHDFVELPDGKLGWLGYEFGPKDPDEGADLGEVRMAWDVIYESEEGAADAGTEELVFNTDGDYPAGVYTIPSDSVRAGPNPAFLCDAYEFGHANSLVYRESDDSYFMMWRWLDTLIKVDRSTPDDPYVWEMGGQFGNLPGDATELFYHAHVSDIWDGSMLVFDNRQRELNSSRLVEYDFDDDGFTQTWEYESDQYEALLGDVRRIPIDGCDNLLVSFSNQGRMVEITREGEIVWDATSAIGNVISRVYYLPDLYDFSGAAYP